MVIYFGWHIKDWSWKIAAETVSAGKRIEKKRYKVQNDNE